VDGSARTARYWACRDEEYPAVAERLVGEVDPPRAGDNATATLRRHGWCRVLDDGQVVHGDTDLSDAQRQTLVALARAHPSMSVREMTASFTGGGSDTYWETGAAPGAAAHAILPPSLFPPASGGWISPEGRVWRCPDSFHEETAGRIAREHGLSGGDPGTMLEHRGWIHVMDNGYVLRTIERLTQLQPDALFDLAQTYPSMRRYLMHALLPH
jgi:hypothetical protein